MYHSLVTWSGGGDGAKAEPGAGRLAMMKTIMKAGNESSRYFKQSRTVALEVRERGREGGRTGARRRWR